MSRQSFAARFTRDELEQQLNDARQEKLAAETTFHKALRHFRRPEADQSYHELPTETELKNERFPMLEHLKSTFADSMVFQLEGKLEIKSNEEKCNTNGHKRDLARIHLHVAQLRHHARLEQASNELRQYEMKIETGDESYVTRKIDKEREIEQRQVHAKQGEDNLQRFVKCLEETVRRRKTNMAKMEELVTRFEDILRVTEELIAQVKQDAQEEKGEEEEEAS